MAMTPASVGVNHPVMMPPSRMIGIIIGSAAARDALARLATLDRGRRNPTGPKK
jgi:hypothetical protein